ncbi:MAG: MFS transporter [Actinobacteria bacterium]|nr:MFS transporter [Actinomycetota bacterium]
MSSVPLRRNRDFVLLQGGQLLSSAGTQLTQIAYPLLVLALTHSAAKAGIVAFARALPLWLFALPAGLAADRFRRRRIMIAADVVRTAAVTALGVTVLLHHAAFWAIAVVAFVEGAGAALFGGAQLGVMRSVVPKPQLPAAMNVLTARIAIVRLAGPPLGGVLFGVTRALPFLADAGSYAASTASLLAMRTPFEEEREPESAPMLQSLVEGIRFLWSSPFLRTIVGIFTLSQIVFPGVSLAVVVIGRRQGLTSGEIGGLVAVFGVFLLLGAAIAPFVRRLLPTRVLIVLEFWTWAGCGLFLIWPSVYVLTATIIPTALAIPTTDSIVWPYQMSLTPDRLMGRATAAVTSLTGGTAALGPLIAGFLLANVSARATIGVFAAFGLAMAAWGTLSPAIRAAPKLEEI